jgi:hypothetical protein
MKNLILLLIAFTIASCSKNDCNGHYMDFENTTHNIMWVKQGEKVLATIPPVSSEVVKFAKCDTTIRIAFISKGYKEKTHMVYIPCCETTYYHGNVQ